MTGTVSYALVGGATGNATLTNGSVSFPVTSPPVGTDVLTLTYSAQGNYQAASVAVTIKVSK